MPPAPRSAAPGQKQKYIRRPYAYPLDFTGVNALAVNGGFAALNMVGDVGIISVFTHISFKADGDFLIQIRPSDLNAGLFNAPISSLTLLALLDRPGMLPAPIKVYGANSLRVELTNDNGAVATAVRLTLWGYRDFPAAN
jgi:hypothetical protein